MRPDSYAAGWKRLQRWKMGIDGIEKEIQKIVERMETIQFIIARQRSRAFFAESLEPEYLVDARALLNEYEKLQEELEGLIQSREAILRSRHSKFPTENQKKNEEE